MKKICVVAINWLGDAIFLTPVFKALKFAYPNAQITCLCVPRVREVLLHCPYVDDVILYQEKGRHFWPWGKLALIAQLRSKGFDAAFLFHRSFTRSLLVWLAGIPVRVGYAKNKLLLTHAYDLPLGQVHRSDSYLSLLESFGLPTLERVCELALNLEDMQALDKRLVKAGLLEGEDYIVFVCGGNWDLKRWPTQYWADLLIKVAQSSDVKIVLSGGQGDKALCQDIIGLSKVNAIDLSGQTSLGQSLALFKRARLVLCADSGPLHLANSVGAHVIALFGPTRPEITGPRGTGESQVIFKEIACNKAPCYHLSCANNLCMKSITSDDVFQVIQKILR